MHPPEEVLDNPVWHALGTQHAPFLDDASSPLARRYQPEVSVFAAVERIVDAAWSALGELVGPSGLAVLMRDRVPSPPTGWSEVFRARVHQMICPPMGGEGPRVEVQRLGPADVEDMVALTQVTEPGPFVSRTPELGRYMGVRRDGRLVAMAGERFRVRGATEISAVCTHPSVRGEGWGGVLTAEVARGIQARGDVAFLHVVTDNEPALRLYRQMGFTTRRLSEVVAAVRS